MRAFDIRTSANDRLSQVDARVVAVSMIASLLLGTSASLAPPDAGGSAARGRPAAGLPPQATASGQAEITGRVADSVSGAGIPRAQVSVTLVGAPAEGQSTLTDDAGGFRISGLTVGTYRATAAKSGYLAAAGEPAEGSVRGSPVSLSSSTESVVNFRLTKAAVITGRVEDAGGDPVGNVVVLLSRRTLVNGQWALRVTAQGVSNDIGEFRISGVRRGRYVIVARPRIARLFDDAGLTLGYAAVGALGTSSNDDWLEVRTGETYNLRFVMDLSPFVPIRGRVSRADGTAGDGASVVVVDRRTRAQVATVAASRDGSFQTAALPHRSYTLRAEAEAGTGGQEVGFAVVSTQSGLDARIALQSPVTVQGQFEAVDRDALSTLRVEGVRVAFRTMEEEYPDIVSNAGVVALDKRFSVYVHPGQYWIDLLGLPPGWAIERVLNGSREITDDGITLRSTVATVPIRIVLTRDFAEVSGVVTDAAGLGVRDSVVVVFPRDRQLWPQSHRYLRTAALDATGRFSFSGLPPGEYCVAAIQDVTVSDVLDPEYLSSLVLESTLVTLKRTEGQKVTVSLARIE